MALREGERREEKNSELRRIPLSASCAEKTRSGRELESGSPKAQSFAELCWIGFVGKGAMLRVRVSTVRRTCDGTPQNSAATQIRMFPVTMTTARLSAEVQHDLGPMEHSVPDTPETTGRSWGSRRTERSQLDERGGGCDRSV